MTNRITTYQHAFAIMGIKIDDKIKNLLESLEKEGHTEKSISYAIWRTQDKINRFIGDSRFMSILKNEICKYSWAKDDPRWKNYWKKKNEEKELENRIQQERKKKIQYLNDININKCTIKCLG